MSKIELNECQLLKKEKSDHKENQSDTNSVNYKYSHPDCKERHELIYQHLLPLIFVSTAVFYRSKKYSGGSPGQKSSQRSRISSSFLALTSFPRRVLGYMLKLSTEIFSKVVLDFTYWDYLLFCVFCHQHQVL